MVTTHHDRQSWRLVATLDAPAGDVVEVAVSRGQATLWYGVHCFELTTTAESGGERVLRIEEVGRRAQTEGDVTVMLLLKDGYHAEQLVVPRRPSCSPGDSGRPDADGRTLRALGWALLDDTARIMDIEGDARDGVSP
jgi:hypothetical protein